MTKKLAVRHQAAGEHLISHSSFQSTETFISFRKKRTNSLLFIQLLLFCSTEWRSAGLIFRGVHIKSVI